MGGDDGGGGRKRGILPLLLGLLALLLLALLLFLLLRGGDDDEGGSSAGSTPTPAATATPASGSFGTLTAGGEDLLPVPDRSALDGARGEAATGREVTVQSVVEGQGFWVGTSETDRVYVELGGDVGEDEQPGQDVQVAEGDRVSFMGEVRPAPEEPAQTLSLSPTDADLVTSQGIFVNAEDVEKAG